MSETLTCPACGEPVWDGPRGHKLAKCWNTAGHADGGTLAFDTMGDDGPEEYRPEEEDDYIGDDRDGYAVSHGGSYVGTYASERRAAAALYLARERSQYWPNVWLVNDHGNMTLCVFDSHVLRETDTAYV